MPYNSIRMNQLSAPTLAYLVTRYEAALAELDSVHAALAPFVADDATRAALALNVRCREATRAALESAQRQQSAGTTEELANGTRLVPAVADRTADPLDCRSVARMVFQVLNSKGEHA